MDISGHGWTWVYSKSVREGLISYKTCQKSSIAASYIPNTEQIESIPHVTCYTDFKCLEH